MSYPRIFISGGLGHTLQLLCDKPALGLDRNELVLSISQEQGTQTNSCTSRQIVNSFHSMHSQPRRLQRVRSGDETHKSKKRFNRCHLRHILHFNSYIYKHMLYMVLIMTTRLCLAVAHNYENIPLASVKSFAAQIQ